MINPIKALNERKKEKEKILLEEQQQRIARLQDIENEVASEGLHIPHPIETFKKKKEIKGLKKEIEEFEKSRQSGKTRHTYIIAFCIVLLVGILVVGIKNGMPSEEIKQTENSIHTSEGANVTAENESEDGPKYEFEYDMAITWQSLHNRTIKLLDFDSGKVTVIYKKGDSVFTGECKRLDNGVICIDTGKPYYYIMDNSGKFVHECDEYGENVYYGIAYSVSDGTEYIDLLQEKLNGAHD
jgi:hypothetical protein